MSGHAEGEHGGPAPPGPGYVETSYRNRPYAYRDDEQGFDLQIEGASLGHMVGRLGPNRYHTHILPFSEFSTPEALAEALIDTEGQAWSREQGEGGEEGGGHGGHG
jgi:hypothetical protein